MKILVTGGAGFIGTHTLVELNAAGHETMVIDNPAKEQRELGWKAQYSIEDMCRDSWNWQRSNPDGYENI